MICRNAYITQTQKFSQRHPLDCGIQQVQLKKTASPLSEFQVFLKEPINLAKALSAEGFEN